MPEGRRVLRIAFWHLEREVPGPVARGLRRLRHPDARWLRIPVGAFFVVGGLASFLPVLGIWMLPLGLLLEPVGRFTIWGTQKWTSFRRSALSRVRQKH